ncbi:hypothetical protein D5W64_12555 [Salmonella enterica subsp. enterica serovar Saintpaul]|nr:hypothetical protein [Salmonella enterica subsp. enterica serovar Saintpaul]
MKPELVFETEDGFIQLLTKDIKSTTLEGKKIFINTYQNTKHHVLGKYQDITAMVRDAHFWELHEVYIAIEVRPSQAFPNATHRRPEQMRSVHYIPCDQVMNVVEYPSGGAIVHLKDKTVISVNCSANEFFKTRRSIFDLE